MKMAPLQSLQNQYRYTVTGSLVIMLVASFVYVFWQGQWHIHYADVMCSFVLRYVDPWLCACGHFCHCPSVFRIFLLAYHITTFFYWTLSKTWKQLFFQATKDSKDKHLNIFHRVWMFPICWKFQPCHSWLYNMHGPLCISLKCLK